MRNTKQKEVILNFINNSFIHPTANDIYNETRIVIPNISLGTVYRTLNKLVEKSLIKRIKMDDHIDRYDRINDFHAHFICLKCNKVYDLKNNFKDHIAKMNHQVVNYEINFRGICEECQKKGKK